MGVIWNPGIGLKPNWKNIFVNIGIDVVKISIMGCLDDKGEIVRYVNNKMNNGTKYNNTAYKNQI